MGSSVTTATDDTTAQGDTSQSSAPQNEVLNQDLDHRYSAAGTGLRKRTPIISVPEEE